MTGTRTRARATETRAQAGRDDTPTIGPAGPADLPAIEALCSAAGLPLDGIADALELGVVARTGGVVVAAAGIERHGAAGLLRSVVVAPPYRGIGLGRAIVAAAEVRARDAGVRELYLLTETAADWFPGLGYGSVGRSVAGVAVGGSVEFRSACPETAVAMRRRLD